MQFYMNKYWYLFMIVIMTNPKCQITQQSCIDNTLKSHTSKTSDLKTQTSKLQTPWKMIEIVDTVLHEWRFIYDTSNESVLNFHSIVRLPSWSHNTA